MDENKQQQLKSNGWDIITIEQFLELDETNLYLIDTYLQLFALEKDNPVICSIKKQLHSTIWGIMTDQETEHRRKLWVRMANE